MFNLTAETYFEAVERVAEDVIDEVRKYNPEAGAAELAELYNDASYDFVAEHQFIIYTAQARRVIAFTNNPSVYHDSCVHLGDPDTLYERLAEACMRADVMDVIKRVTGK